MWTKAFSTKFGRLVVRGLVRWLEMLGQNPPLSRDCSLLAWPHLHGRSPLPNEGAGQGDRRVGESPAAPVGWVPPVVRSGPPSIHLSA